MQTVKIMFQILFVMYWVVLGLLVSLKIYTPKRSIIAMAFIMTGVLAAFLVFGSVQIN